MASDIKFQIELLARDKASKLFKEVEANAQAISKAAKSVAKNFSGVPRVAKNLASELRRAGTAIKPILTSVRKLGTPFKRLAGSAKKFGLSLKNLIPSFNLVAVAAGAAAAAYSATKVVEASSRQQDALNSVATSLKRVGEGSRENLQEIQKFASELQDLTGVGDESSLEMFALAQSFGASKNQAKEVTAAAIELSAATGKSLQEATAQVSKTLGGFAGELGEVNPAIKALSKEQLQAGEAARILLDQYGGTAASKLQTFSGATTNLSGRFGDLLETIGDLITKNPVVVKLVGKLAKAFKNLGSFFSENRVELTRFINNGIILALKALQQLTKGVSLTVRVVGLLANGLIVTGKNMGLLVAALSGFDLVHKTINIVRRTIQFLGFELANLVKFILDSGLGAEIAEKLGINVEEARKSVKKFQTDILNSKEEIDKSEIEQFGLKIAENFDEANTSVDEFIKNATDKLGGIDESLGELTIEVGKVNTKDDIEAAGIVGEFKEEDNKGPPKPQSPDQKEKSRLQNATENFTAALGRGLTRGAEGAAEVITAGIAGISDFFLPGTGAFAKPFLDLLALGPDAAKEQVKAFAEAIPDIVIAIAEALPAVIEGLAEALPDVIVSLVKNLDVIVVALLKGVIGLFKALIQITIEIMASFLSELFDMDLSFNTEKLNNILETSFQRMADFFTAIFGGLDRTFQNFGSWVAEAFDKILRGIGEVFTTIYKGLDQAFTNIGATVTKAFEDARMELERAFSNAGRAITDPIGEWFENEFIKPLNDWLDRLADLDPTKDLGFGPADFREGAKTILTLGTNKIFGFAEGGIVPNGFPNDTFPARLTSGELIVPPNDTARLSDFLDQQEAGGGMSEALLAQIVTLLSQPVQVSATAEVNQEAFADIILDLNRQNQRLD